MSDGQTPLTFSLSDQYNRVERGQKMTVTQLIRAVLELAASSGLPPDGVTRALVDAQQSVLRAAQNQARNTQQGKETKAK